MSYEFIQADITNEKQVLAACEGVDTVFHVTAIAKGPPGLMHKVNVRGTEIILQSCIKKSVKRLIYTCSASVVFNGEDIFDGTEDLPYRSFDDYGRTKGEAERMVLEYGKQKKLMTASVRPHTIFGPGDSLSWPTIIGKAREGKMRYLLGTGKEICSFTYVDNLCHCEILAAQKLDDFSSPANGEAFFVNDNHDGKLWEYIYSVAELSGMDKTKFGSIYIPYPIVATFGRGLKLMGIDSVFNPQWLATIATSHTYSTAKAREVLGYSPIVAHDEGLERTRKYFTKWADDNPRPKPNTRAKYLSYWLMFIALLSTIGWVQAFAGMLGNTQFSLKPEEATGLAGRLFGAWTLVAGIVRGLCALDVHNVSLYRATFCTFLVAGGIYSFEFFVAQSIPLNRAWGPFVVASLSLVAMAFFPPKKTR